MRQRPKEREIRRGVKVLYGVLSGSCIQSAVISGHPLYCVQLYSPDFHQNKMFSPICLIPKSCKYLTYIYFFVWTITANYITAP